jgi:hypothetical protein
LKKTNKKILAGPRESFPLILRLFLLLLFLILFLSPVFAIEVGELEKYSEDKYGPEYFFAIKGEIYGQTVPGIQAVYVNGNPVRISKDLSFRTNVYLAKGQKYLVVESRYQGLRFIKKYLVIRHPKAKKTFKIHVPKKEFQDIISKVKPQAKKKPVRKPAAKKPAPKPRKIVIPIAENWLGYAFVAELEPGKLLVVRQVGQKYFGLVLDRKTNVWISLAEFTYEELKTFLEENLPEEPPAPNDLKN